jgi:hypothetical protein
VRWTGFWTRNTGDVSGWEIWKKRLSGYDHLVAILAVVFSISCDHLWLAIHGVEVGD